MINISQIKLPLDYSQDNLLEKILSILRIESNDLIDFYLIKRSIDARDNSNIFFICSVNTQVKNEKSILNKFKNDNRIKKVLKRDYFLPVKAPESFPLKEYLRPVIVGAGPCGYFAALLLAQMGFKPLLLERGQTVKERTFKCYGFWRKGYDLDLESNVQFGEGGAGTFSDGKLYSQISDPNNYGRKVLEEFVASGANAEILYKHRPHIGTFKLASIVRGFRSRIKALGGEIRFETKMEELILKKSSKEYSNNKEYQVHGLKLSDGSFVRTNYLILALGHSARDSFQMLDEVGVCLEQKLFSVGFRIEHPQIQVDKERWGGMCGHSQLGHAEYKLVHHASNGRDVYSFCMCPGGLVVGATSEKECVVTNGMSQHGRNEKNANSGLVVNLQAEDLIKYERWPGDPLAGIAFQKNLEMQAFNIGGKDYSAPAQRLEDFLAGRPSNHMGKIKPSYLPGIKLADLNQSLPKPFIEAIKEALPVFGDKFSFYKEPDAILTGVETRTSSPLRIPRDKFFESVNVLGLFPAGEGAGYAGGILSAGIDGIKVAEEMAKKILR